MILLLTLFLQIAEFLTVRKVESKSYIGMKTIFSLACIAAAATCVLTSCDPQAFSMNIEMRYPSKSGIDLTGKSVAVVYLEDGAGKDSVFSRNMADSFAASLEKEYFGGETSVPLYRIEKTGNGNYASVDSLSRLVMSTGEDVIFLFERPRFGEAVVEQNTIAPADTSLSYVVKVPMKMNLYAYDSMGKIDTVYTWSGSRTLNASVSTDAYTDPKEKAWDALSMQGQKIGEMSSRIFMPEWKAEQYTFIYFESDGWDVASQAAYSYKWKEAIEEWMKLLETNNTLKRSCAEFNIATACYMLGDNELALKWLDRSDADYPVSLSSGLRKRINARKK